MRKLTVIPAVVGAVLLAGCSSDADKQSADIAKISEVKGSFGPEFKVVDVPTTGIDPKIMAGQKLPPELKFAPPECAKFAAGPQMPADIKGNMAAVSAEGAGNRFIAIALETSSPIPVVEPSDGCKKVTFEGGPLHGLVEVLQVPKIDGVGTQGIHRVLQTTVNGKPQTGEIYNYKAYFGNFQVIVTANPLVVPGQPVTPVDTKRAEDLLTAAVAAIRG